MPRNPGGFLDCASSFALAGCAVHFVAFGLYRPLRRPVRAGGPYSGVHNYVKRGNSMRSVPQKSISSLLNALAGCERHCAVLLASEHQSICSPHTAILNESALGRRSPLSSGLKNWIHGQASVYGGGHFTRPSYLTVTCSVLFRLRTTGYSEYLAR